MQLSKVPTFISASYSENLVIIQLLHLKTACWIQTICFQLFSDDGIVTCSLQRPLPAHGALGTAHQSKASTGGQQQQTCTHSTPGTLSAQHLSIISRCPRAPRLISHTMTFVYGGILVAILMSSGVSNLVQHQKHSGNFQKIQIYEPHPVLLNQCFLKPSQVTIMVRARFGNQ